MDLNQYMQLSVSIAATLFSILLITLLSIVPSILKKIHEIIDRFDNISKLGLEASTNLKDFVERTTNNINAFVAAFTSLQGAKEVVGIIGDAIHKAKEKKEK